MRIPLLFLAFPLSLLCIGCASSLEISQNTIPNGFINDDTFRIAGYGAAPMGEKDMELRKTVAQERATENAQKKILPLLARTYNQEMGTYETTQTLSKIIEARIGKTIPETITKEAIFDEKGNCLIITEMHENGLRQLFIASVRKGLILIEGEGWISPTRVRAAVLSVSLSKFETEAERRKAMQPEAYEAAKEKLAQIFLTAYLEAKETNIDKDAALEALKSALDKDKFDIDEVLIESNDEYMSVDAVYEVEHPDLQAYIVKTVDETIARYNEENAIER